MEIEKEEIESVKVCTVRQHILTYTSFVKITFKNILQFFLGTNLLDHKFYFSAEEFTEAAATLTSEST